MIVINNMTNGGLNICLNTLGEINMILFTRIDTEDIKLIRAVLTNSQKTLQKKFTKQLNTSRLLIPEHPEIDPILTDPKYIQLWQKLEKIAKIIKILDNLIEGQ